MSFGPVFHMMWFLYVTGIVEEVYAAQKKRDDASLGRMRLVNEEKEDVIERLRNMERRLDEERYVHVLNR